MATRNDLTAERARKFLRYDPETGIFSRFTVGSKDPAKRKTWRQVGSIGIPHGYLMISACGAVYRAGRLAWLMHHGKWPAGEIGYADGDKTNNRIKNLRDQTAIQTAENRKVRSDSTSGYIGVTWHKGIGKWKAQIGAKGVNHHLGYFAKPLDASKAYQAAKARMHGAVQPARP